MITVFVGTVEEDFIGSLKINTSLLGVKKENMEIMFTVKIYYFYTKGLLALALMSTS